jgi:hypothetical protein
LFENEVLPAMTQLTILLLGPHAAMPPPSFVELLLTTVQFINLRAGLS